MPSIGLMLAYFSYVALMFFLRLILAPVRQGEPGGEAGGLPESPAPKREKAKVRDASTHQGTLSLRELTAPEKIDLPNLS